MEGRQLAYKLVPLAEWPEKEVKPLFHMTLETIGLFLIHLHAKSLCLQLL